MLRIAIVGGCLALGACSPSFEDKLVGTWECTPAAQKADAPLKMTQTLTYGAKGDINGSILVEEKSEHADAVMRGKVTGSWKYNGSSVVHTTTEEFEELKVGDKVVPRDEVSPMLLSGFRPESTYDVTVDLQDNSLTWFEDVEKKKPIANCTRQTQTAS